MTTTLDFKAQTDDLERYYEAIHRHAMKECRDAQIRAERERDYREELEFSQCRTVDGDLY